MIIDWSRKLGLGRFILPDEKVQCIDKVEGLKKGKVYNVLSYVPDKILIKNKKGINVWYKTKHFKLA